MLTKRGQAAGAAVLLAVIMGLVILFIVLLPPAEREKLFGEEAAPAVEKKAAEEAPKVVKEVLLKESPGRLSYLEEREVEKLIPSTHIFTETKSVVLLEREYLAPKQAAFSSQKEEIPFALSDLENTKNVLLDFVIESYQGELIISLNGEEIFQRETNKISPIKLPRHLLARENVLTFEASSPGLAFWQTNYYQLKNLKIVAEVTDVSAQKSEHLLYIKPEEAENIEEAALRFSLSCLPTKAGKIEVKLNDYSIFSGVPENCEDILYYTLPPAIIKTGDNWLSFKTEEGDYELSHIAVKIKLKAPSYPVYYFELKEGYFTKLTEKTVECGLVDGLCPENCDEDADKDCCFREYVTPFWCDAKTKQSDDRCVGRVDRENCERCPSGYEDKSGSPPEACEELCGDDTDDYCPSHCHLNYDQDCCFGRSGSQYWCADLPTSGIDFTCLDSLSYDECSLCPANYEGEETQPECPLQKVEEGKEELKKAYDILLTLEFADEEKKEAELYLNGHKISFDTYKVEFSRQVDSYVQPWTNSIKIIPKNSFDLKELTVELKG